MNKQNFIVVLTLAIVVVIVFIVPNPAGNFLRGIIDKASSESITEDEAWQTFVTYRDYAGAKDLEGLSQVAFQLGETCRDTSKRSECDEIMAGIAPLMMEFKREDFKHFVSDEKQAMWTSDWNPPNTVTGFKVYDRKLLYFARGEDGGVKLLYAALPFEGIFIPIGNKTDAEIQSEFEKTIVDADQDGMGDTNETSTSPQVRDSDADGWWDGTEIYFR